jgi:hypothetical protein
MGFPGFSSILPMSVFPVPGGPNKSNPLGGPRRPLKISLDARTLKE